MDDDRLGKNVSQAGDYVVLDTGAEGLGIVKLDNAVANIYPDPYIQSAPIILQNADDFFVHGKGLVRLRWLGKLCGLYCLSAIWLPVFQSFGARSVALKVLCLGHSIFFRLTITTKRIMPLHSHGTHRTVTNRWHPH